MFFIFMMIFGNLMLLNLFLAILLKFISENQVETDETTGDTNTNTQNKIDPAGETKDKDKQSQDGHLSGVGSSKNDGGGDKKGADAMAGGDSGPLNSSNSNIEEEFEQIKL
jgi:hypothetical protein